MGAKNGRRLLKRHYVALIEDAGGVQGPGRSFIHTLTLPPSHTPPPPTTEKIKVSTLKNMFWSQPDVYSKYMYHSPLTSSGESSGDDDEVTAGNDDDLSLSSDESINDHDDDVVSACGCVHL